MSAKIQVFIVSVLATKEATVAVEEMEADMTQIRHFPFISQQSTREEAEQEAIRLVNKYLPDVEPEEGWEVSANAVAIMLVPSAKDLGGGHINVRINVEVDDDHLGELNG